MSTARFDELIHAPTRLAIVSLLAAAQWADFKYIRDELGLSDSALSKQLSTLESAGHVQIRKRFVGKYPRTSASLQPSRPPGIRAARGGPPANRGQIPAEWRRQIGRRGRPRDPRTLSRRTSDGGRGPTPSYYAVTASSGFRARHPYLDPVPLPEVRAP